MNKGKLVGKCADSTPLRDSAILKREAILHSASKAEDNFGPGHADYIPTKSKHSRTVSAMGNMLLPKVLSI